MVYQLKVSTVKTGYHKFLLSNIDFSISGGQILGIIGKSGCGKSTLIKTLLGLKKPIEGKIELYDNKNLLDFQQSIGYSPQDNALFTSLSIKENCKIFASMHGVSAKDFKTNFGSLMTMLGLTDAQNKLITQLSGGMQKRADLAVTLIHNPNIIILDEPFNGLDIAIQTFIWDFLRKLALQGKIIIITSHLLEDIQNNCNLYGLIHQGFYYNDASIRSTLKSAKLNLVEYARSTFK